MKPLKKNHSFEWFFLVFFGFSTVFAIVFHSIIDFCPCSQRVGNPLKKSTIDIGSCIVIYCIRIVISAPAFARAEAIMRKTVKTLLILLLVTLFTCVFVACGEVEAEPIEDVPPPTHVGGNGSN